MDLRLNEDQEMIRNAAREFLQSECPMASVRALEEDPKGYSPELWRKMAELGFMGVAFSEDYGGIGKGFLELCLLIEEYGRSGLSGPFFATTVLCGLPIAEYGADAQKNEHLSAIADGKCIMTYAESEPGAAWGPAGVRLTAAARDDGYVLDGVKLFVPYADVADHLLVAACTGGSEGGITLFLVDAKTSGIACERQETIGPDRQYEVTFSNVLVPKENVLGQVHAGERIMRAINEWGAAAKCAEMVGGAQRVLEMSVEYAKQRVQFGRPIGAFQAVQHHCANMAVSVDSSRFVAYEAIWRLSEGLDASMEVSMAKAWVSDAYQQICTLGHQVHGAMGFTKEHDMQLYFRHAKASELAFGDGDYHRELLAQQLDL